MSEAIEQPAGAEEGLPANESETEVELSTTTEKEGAADGTEKEAETEEQKNERARLETAAKAEKRASGVQKRINELTADKFAERKRADELADQNRRILALLESKGATVQVTEAQGEPKPESYTDYNAYVRDLAIYHAKHASTVKVEEQAKAFDEANRQREAAAAQRERGAKYAEGVRAAQAKYPDYAEVMEDAASVDAPQSVIDLLFNMGADGADIAYHFVKNPAMAKQFDGQPRHMHGILLGQILATLKGTAQTSKAPPPAKGVAASTVKGSAPPEDADAYMAWAAKNLR